MAMQKWIGLVAVAVLVAGGCFGGGEVKKETFTLSVKVSHQRYKAKHTGVTREVTPQAVKERVMALQGMNNVRRQVALADLVAMGREQPRAISLIIDKLDHKDPRVRESTLLALAQIGPDVVELSSSKLRNLIVDPDERVICATLFAISMLKVKDRRLMKKAFEYLSHPSPSIRSFAAECIRKLAFWPAIPALIYGHLGKEACPIQVRVYAWEALENITLAKVDASPKAADMFSILKARAAAWKNWWELNRYKYEG
jgi:hypothetical protein